MLVTQDYIDELIRSGGNVRLTAARLDRSRTAVYNKIIAEGLWPLVNQLRKDRLSNTSRSEEELIKMTKLVLKGQS